MSETSYESKWIFSEMLLNAVGEALDGEQPSDFELSFPVVRKAYDLYLEGRAPNQSMNLNTINCAICGEGIDREDIICKECLK
jgi:hypothetical protein